MTDKKEFRAYMKAAQTTMSDNGQHLSEAGIIAYCRRAMSGAELEAAQAHLVSCEQCIALFRSARDFVEVPGPDDEAINTADTDDAWASLLQRLPKATAVDDAETNVVRTDLSRPRDKRRLGDSRLTLALAASLIISFGVLGLLGWRLREEQNSRRQSQQAALEFENRQRELEQRLSQLEQKGADELKRERAQRLAAEAERDQLQSLLATVHPEQPHPVYSFRLSFERGSEEELSLSFKKGVQAVKLRLFQSKPYEFLEYAIEVVDQRGQVVREISRRRPARADGALSVQLNRAGFATGKYKLRLLGRQGVTKKQLGEFGLAITVER